MAASRPETAFQIPPRPPPGLEKFGPKEVGLVRREAKMESDLLPFSDASTTDADSMSRCSRCVQLDEASSSPQVAGSPSRAQSNGAPCAIQLQRMLEDSTPDYPSKGSAAHHLGLCKPCDFKCRSSCRFGYECMFCHICGPAESRQWKRGRKSFWRQARASLRHTLPSTGTQGAIGSIGSISDSVMLNLHSALSL